MREGLSNSVFSLFVRTSRSADRGNKEQRHVSVFEKRRKKKKTTLQAQGIKLRVRIYENVRDSGDETKQR